MATCTAIALATTPGFTHSVTAMLYLGAQTRVLMLTPSSNQSNEVGSSGDNGSPLGGGVGGSGGAGGSGGVGGATARVMAMSQKERRLMRRARVKLQSLLHSWQEKVKVRGAASLAVLKLGMSMIAIEKRRR